MGCNCFTDKSEYEINNQRFDELSKLKTRIINNILLNSNKISKKP